MPTYGGDEVSAVVLDIGSSTTRAGYAGEDTPKVVIPTSFGYNPASSDGPGASSQGTYYFGDHGPTLWRAGMEVVSPLKDSIVEDWAATEQLMHVVFDREMRLGLPGAELEPEEKRGILTEHPLLVTEPSWNSKENRERMIELAFEQFDTPAYYSVDRAVMSAFAAGKGSALVVDIGEELTTVTPIFDGFVLRKGIQKSPIAGSLISSLLLSATEAQLPTPVYPHYLVASKPSSSSQPPNPIGPDSDTPMPPAVDTIPAGVVLRDSRMPGKEGSGTTDSFAKFQKMRVMHDLKETVCEVFPRSWDEEAVSAMPTRTFEFPTGQLQQYGRNRFAIPEVFFTPSLASPDFANHIVLKHPASTIPTPDLTAALSLPQLVMMSISSCDVDVQAILNANIIVTGATSLIPGLAERLDSDLRALAPGMKFKITATGNVAERRFGSWLGGSILASLGSFHQLWIGKDEYKEQGRTVVHRRCK